MTTEARDPLDEAYRHHEGFVRARLRRLGVSPVRLDDAVQDVFMVVTRRRADYDPRYGYRRWLSGIARFVAGAHRKAAARAPVSVQLDSTMGPDAAHRIDEAIAIMQAAEHVDRDQCGVLWLHEVEGRTAAEIAHSRGLPLTTIQWRLRAARRALQEALRGVRFACVAWLPRFGVSRASPLMKLQGWSTLGSAATASALAVVMLPSPSLDVAAPASMPIEASVGIAEATERSPTRAAAAEPQRFDDRGLLQRVEPRRFVSGRVREQGPEIRQMPSTASNGPDAMLASTVEGVPSPRPPLRMKRSRRDAPERFVKHRAPPPSLEDIAVVTFEFGDHPVLGTSRARPRAIPSGEQLARSELASPLSL